MLQPDRVVLLLLLGRLRRVVIWLGSFYRITFAVLVPTCFRLRGADGLHPIDTVFDCPARRDLYHRPDQLFKSTFNRLQAKLTLSILATLQTEN